MAGYRPSFTLDEDLLILNLIIESQLYYSLRGTLFWKDLSSVGRIDRTWQSLKNRFQRFIFPKLDDPCYTVPVLEKRKIQLAWFQTSADAKDRRKKNSSYSSSDEESNKIGTLRKRTTILDKQKKKSSYSSSDEESDRIGTLKKRTTILDKRKKNSSYSSSDEESDRIRTLRKHTIILDSVHEESDDGPSQSK